MQNMDTSPHTLCARQIASWGLPELRQEPLIYPIAGIPSLQRGLVWKPAQTELLWDSLLRGFPIGAFVLCPKLTGQKTRDEKKAGQFSHHLLDGQQRAHAIKLGFEDPFSGEEERRDSKKHILWLDLDPKPELKGTRSFLVRLTTQAHPWGYAADDDASPLSIDKIRKSLEKSGHLEDGKLLVRPSPRKYWPIDAGSPVPFSWLVEAHGKEDFWGAIEEKCEGCNETWAKHALDSLTKPSARPNLEHIREAIERTLKAQIVWLELKKEVLDALSPQEAGKRARQEDTGENIANVEHLFQRLNASGTRLEGDELAYSMIKAYWPEVEDRIKKIADRRMPEARLFTLASRTALSPTKSGEEEKNRQILHGPVSVSEIRQFGAILKPDGEKIEESEGKNPVAEERKKKAVKIRRFIFDPGVNLEYVLKRIENWLGTGEEKDDIGLPPVLKTSIARGSPEVWLLLMWLARRTLEEGYNDSIFNTEMRKPVLGLATALH